MVMSYKSEAVMGIQYSGPPSHNTVSSYTARTRDGSSQLPPRSDDVTHCGPMTSAARRAAVAATGSPRRHSHTHTDHTDLGALGRHVPDLV